MALTVIPAVESKLRRCQIWVVWLTLAFASSSAAQPGARQVLLLNSGLDGIAAASLIRRHNSNARIVLVTVHSEPMLVEAGLAVGALGYVLKDTAGDDLVAAVHAALDGQRYVSKELSHLTGEDSPD